MWIPAGIVLTLMGLALFMAWLGESERRASRHAQRRAAELTSRLTPVLLMAAVATLTAGCSARTSDERIARELTGGDPARGRVAIHNHGCDACHTIPGILTATATVGPPLTQVAVRARNPTSISAVLAHAMPQSAWMTSGGGAMWPSSIQMPTGR